MSPPPIRYPLPTLLLLMLLALTVWWGADLIQSVRTAVVDRARKIVITPIPTEPDPKLTAGPFPARGLLLHGETTAAKVPDGPLAETIGKRRLVDVLNVWPLRGEPTHYRVGNDRAYGWVKAVDLLRWDTRLVLRVPPEGLKIDATGGTIAGGGPPLPVLRLDPDSRFVELAEWDREAPWQRVRRRVSARLDDLPPDSLEAFLTRGELLELVKRRDPAPATTPDSPLRIRALAGRLIGEVSPWPPEDQRQASATLAPILDHAGPPSQDSTAALTRINENWQADASWNGVPFRGIPLTQIP